MSRKYAVQMLVQEFDSMREAAEFAERLSENFADMPEAEDLAASIVWGALGDDRKEHYVH